MVRTASFVPFSVNGEYGADRIFEACEVEKVGIFVKAIGGDVHGRTGVQQKNPVMKRCSSTLATLRETTVLGKSASGTGCQEQREQASDLHSGLN